jgi:nitrite reductase/ring-hydroxylating ferredoxin subunit
VDGADCVVCPWHGSTFRLSDGAVVHGPAGTNQPMLRSRIRDGRVEASLP